jgi:integrase
MRDAGISVAGSLLLALLAVWFYDFLNRPLRRAVADIQPVFVSTQEPAALHQVSGDRLTHNQATRVLEQPLPRELSDTEVLAQLQAAAADTRLLMACLLSGLNTEELSALRWRDIELDTGIVRIPKQMGRTLAISAPMRAAIAASMPADPDPDAPVWRDAAGEALSANNLEALIACAAHDAGLTRPSEITSRTLLHTYLAHLVRKGVKLSELDNVVGVMAPTVRAAHGVFSPPGAARSLDAIERDYPVLQQFFETQTGGLCSTDQ